MYRIFTIIYLPNWVILRVNVDTYSIHGAYMSIWVLKLKGVIVHSYERYLHQIAREIVCHSLSV